MPFPRKYNAPVDFHFQLERADKESAEQALVGTGFTLADYLRQCVDDLVEGRVEVVAAGADTAEEAEHAGTGGTDDVV